MSNKQLIVLSSIIALLFLLFFFGGPDYYSPRSYKYFWNLGHIIFFILLTQLLLDKRFFLSKAPLIFQLIIPLAISLLVGFIIEWIQVDLSRSFSVSDLWRNFLGASVGIYLFSDLQKLTKKLIYRAFSIVLLLLVFWEVLPVFYYWQDEMAIENSFPLISNFENAAEVSRWSGNSKISRSDRYASLGFFSLKVETNTENYTGINLDYATFDWRGYETLSFDIYNPELEAIRITIRVHDVVHRNSDQLYLDRFNHSIDLKQGWNTINLSLQDIKTAPLNRAMTLAEVAGFGFFVSDPAKSYLLYLDNVHLIK